MWIRQFDCWRNCQLYGQIDLSCALYLAVGVILPFKFVAHIHYGCNAEFFKMGQCKFRQLVKFAASYQLAVLYTPSVCYGKAAQITRVIQLG